MRELARVLRPGGTLACLEFYRPDDRALHAGWWAYTRLVMPVVGAVVSPAWRYTGRFLGPSISGFYDRYPLPEQVRWWQAAGLRHVRTRVMSLGAGDRDLGGERRTPCRLTASVPPTANGRRSTRSRPGGWRDYWTLLHPPYTMWHLSYVVMGASLASGRQRPLARGDVDRVLPGDGHRRARAGRAARPAARHADPRRRVVGAGRVGLAGAVALGIDGAREVSPWIWAFIAPACSWCSPTTSSCSAGWSIPTCGSRWRGARSRSSRRPSRRRRASNRRPLALAAACAAISAAQRVLSTPVRRLRRRIATVEGTITSVDGDVELIDAGTLRSAPERALRWMSLAMPLLALADAAAEAAGLGARRSSSSRPLRSTDRLDAGRAPRTRSRTSVSSSSNVETDAISGRSTDRSELKTTTGHGDAPAALTNDEMIVSSRLKLNASSAPASTAGSIRGSVICRKRRPGGA